MTKIKDPDPFVKGMDPDPDPDPRQNAINPEHCSSPNTHNVTYRGGEGVLLSFLNEVRVVAGLPQLHHDVQQAHLRVETIIIKQHTSNRYLSPELFRRFHSAQDQTYVPI
jgi:hypothetical protein